MLIRQLNLHQDVMLLKDGKEIVRLRTPRTKDRRQKHNSVGIEAGDDIKIINEPAKEWDNG